VKNNLLKSIFSSGLQAIAVQIIGVAFFFVISLYLSKDDFGTISTLNGLAMMLTTLLSFGLEQVVVRRIAASKTSDWAAAAFLFHAFAGSVLGFMLVWAIASFAGADQSLKLLPWFFLAQSITYIGAPLKQFLNARQQFTPYGVIALIGNVCKITLAFILVLSDGLTIETVYIILIICATIELVGLLGYVFTKTDLRPTFRKKAYFKLLKEAMPQYMVVIFDSSISRIDIVLMGFITTKAITGDYGFAYRAFEISRLPIVIIAPIIMVKFARMFGGAARVSEDKKTEVSTLFAVEIFLATLIPLVLNVLWGPVVDYISKGKYGYSNSTEFMILSVCIPFQFAINILWTLAFTNKRYKVVSAITIATAATNLLLNLVFIPLYGGIGAACVFLGTILLQVGMYYYVVRKRVMHLPVKSLVAFLLFGIIAYYTAFSVVENVVLQLLIAIGIYLALSFGLKQIGKQHLITLKAYLKK
jgi:O-antigen/teichoic acid export membrane protein